jgi:hypothetical protein
MGGRDEDEAIEAATAEAVAEAFAEYEARERAARAPPDRAARAPATRAVTVRTEAQDPADSSAFAALSRGAGIDHDAPTTRPHDVTARFDAGLPEPRGTTLRIDTRPTEAPRLPVTSIGPPATRARPDLHAQRGVTVRIELPAPEVATTSRVDARVLHAQENADTESNPPHRSRESQTRGQTLVPAPRDPVVRAQTLVPPPREPVRTPPDQAETLPPRAPAPRAEARPGAAAPVRAEIIAPSRAPSLEAQALRGEAAIPRRTRSDPFDEATVRTALPVPIDPFAEATPVLASARTTRSIAALDPTQHTTEAQVAAWLDGARRADYFATLGLDPRAGTTDVERAYAQAVEALEQLDPSPLTREARATLDGAHDVLADPTTRSTYARHLGAGPAVPIFWLPAGDRGP